MASEFYALCDSHPNLPGGWQGPLRTTREEAQRDADEHNKANAGHNATVVEL